MTDIPALIEEADKVLAAPIAESLTGPFTRTVMISASVPSVFISRDMLRRIREALSRLTVSPLPGEIAGGIERLKRAASHAAEMPYVQGQCLWAAAALERMARETQSRTETIKLMCERSDMQFARIRELEAAAVSPLPEEIAGLLALKEGLPEDPWLYRPYQHDDWGIVRGGLENDGSLRIIATGCSHKYLHERELDEHRRNKTDPYGAVAKAIAAIPRMFAALKRMVRENADKTAAIKHYHSEVNRLANLDALKTDAIDHLARENERLKEADERANKLLDEQDERIESLQGSGDVLSARIRELEAELKAFGIKAEGRRAGDYAKFYDMCEHAEKAEAERDTLSKLLNATEDQRDRAWAERDNFSKAMKYQAECAAELADAIRAKTTEECLHTTVTVRGFGTASDDYLNGFHDGALAKTESIRALHQQEKPSPETE